MKIVLIPMFFIALSVPVWATTYYLAPATASPAGNDSNAGTSAAPWLSPNHAVNCGDILIAKGNTYASPMVYSSANFYNGKWGVVTCPATNNVASVVCQPAFTCSITDTAQAAMFISASYWGVQGFVLSTTGGGGSCISIAPSYSANAQIDHIIIANNIIGPCVYDGIGEQDGYGTAPVVGVDYLAYLGNIVYNTGGNSTTCSAGLSFYAPVASNTLPGTHHYMAGNFAWGNTSNCGDGEGIIFDTLDGVEAGWPTDIPYNQQMVAENNLMVWNNGPGVQVDLNMNGTPSSWAPVYFRNNTSAYNNQGPSTANYCAEIVLGTTVRSESTGNLSVAPTQYCFGGSTITHFGTAPAYSPTATNKVYREFAYSSFGTGVGSVASSGFVSGPSNITSTDPSLVNPVNPGTPSCSGFSTTTACMATVIANYAPATASAKQYGYQLPSTTSRYNPLYPRWLCGVTGLPTGIVTPGCVSASVKQ